MTVVSVRNCTRFPISVLKYCGWIESVRCKIYGKSMVFMKLTAHGKETAKKIKTYKDIRLDDYDELSESQRKALIRLGTYSMLSRAKFETNEVQAEMEQDSKEIEGLTEGKEILFSPYQTLDLITVNDALNKSIEQIVEILVMEHSKDNQGEFYPLVEVLFRIIGVDCHKSRDGVNGERWDAMIRDVHRSIPIEIKSPGEEENISIKAIRQALENKIVLLSRKTYVTDNETSSFAVGYRTPNDRAERY